MKRLILALLLVLGWLFINEPLKAADIFYFTSSPTSWVGQGQTITLTSPTSTFLAINKQNGGGRLPAVQLIADSYNLCLLGPEDTLPTVGFYANATRYPFSSPGAGLSFWGDGRGDNTLTGYFNVLQANYDINGKILSFAVDFTQYDEGVKANWVSGSFRYNSDIPVPEPATLLLLGLGGLFLRRKR